MISFQRSLFQMHSMYPKLTKLSSLRQLSSVSKSGKFSTRAKVGFVGGVVLFGAPSGYYLLSDQKQQRQIRVTVQGVGRFFRYFYDFSFVLLHPNLMYKKSISISEISTGHWLSDLLFLLIIGGLFSMLMKTLKIMKQY